MKLVCPSCGAIHSAEGWSTDADARQCLRLVAELPTEVSRRSLAYLALFRPGSGRGLTWGKALRLLGELKIMVSDATVAWDRKPARPNSAMAWAEAMERVVQQPPKRLPLKSHGYLTAIAYEIADEMDRKKEVMHNQAERDGRLNRNRRSRTTDTCMAPAISVTEMRAIRERNMGKKR